MKSITWDVNWIVNVIIWDINWIVKSIKYDVFYSTDGWLERWRAKYCVLHWKRSRSDAKVGSTRRRVRAVLAL